MTKRKKAFERLLTKPNDFTWGELWSLMESLGYELRTVGGSKQKFVHPETSAMLFIHEPHPSKVLKVYQVKDAIYFLRQEKHIP